MRLANFIRKKYKIKLKSSQLYLIRVPKPKLAPSNVYINITFKFTCMHYNLKYELLRKFVPVSVTVY